MRQHLLPTKAGQNHCITANWGKNRIKSLRNGNKSNNPFAFPHFLLVLPRFFAFFLFFVFFVFWPCFALLPKAHFSLSWQFCWLVSSPAGFVCVCFPRWPITHLAKAQSRPKLAQAGPNRQIRPATAPKPEHKERMQRGERRTQGSNNKIECNLFSSYC